MDYDVIWSMYLVEQSLVVVVVVVVITMGYLVWVVFIYLFCPYRYDGLHHGSSYLEHLNFLSAIRTKGEKAPSVDLQDGLVSVAMGVAAQLSIEYGRFVTIEEVMDEIKNWGCLNFGSGSNCCLLSHFFDARMLYLLSLSNENY